MGFQFRSLFSWMHTENHRTAWISLGIIVAILLILNIVSLSKFGFISLTTMHFFYLFITLSKMAAIVCSFYYFFKCIWRKYKLSLYVFSLITIIVFILLFFTFKAVDFTPGIFAFLFEILYVYVGYNYLRIFSSNVLP